MQLYCIYFLYCHKNFLILYLTNTNVSLCKIRKFLWQHRKYVCACLACWKTVVWSYFFELLYAALSIDQLHKLLLHLFCPFAGPENTKNSDLVVFKQWSVMIKHISQFFLFIGCIYSKNQFSTKMRENNHRTSCLFIATWLMVMILKSTLKLEVDI